MLVYQTKEGMVTLLRMKFISRKRPKAAPPMGLWFRTLLIDVMKEYRENPSTCDKNAICDELDEIVEKYTPSKEDLRKNTLLDDLARGTSKIVVTDEKADDELNWENIGL